ncbi:MAG: class I SAM-dependent methyltransferase [Anaerolineae bacterium]
MNLQNNLNIYRRWAGVYDALFGPLFGRARRRAIAALALRPGERLLLPGVGTGLDLPHLPPAVITAAGDFSPAMLAKALEKARPRHGLHQHDAQRLPLPSASCDAALLSLIVSVAPDGAAVAAEAWHVLKPGGRLVIFDKFLPETASVTAGRRLLGGVIARLGTDVNRRLSDILPAAPELVIEWNEPSLLRGQYRIIRLRKATGPRDTAS